MLIVLPLVEKYKISQLKEPKQMFPPNPQYLEKDKRKMIDMEMKKIFEKRTIFQNSHQKEEFLSLTFLSGKKGGPTC